ncbi:MAG: ATP-binding protein [Candidatus Gracilibacteria bacterium]|nr:ATP-binding protein [Candidatus Gracilibacteria bacterium]
MIKKSDLPIGIQTFKDIINENYIYVDKTKEALELINDFKYVFLSRPRRFGKSLFLDTLKNIFEGKKELFRGLYLEDKIDWEDKYPVIKIDFYGDLRSSKSIKASILKTLESNQKDLGVECDKNNEAYNYSTCFRDLIRKSYEKYNKKVVILIDEYDKAILDNLDQNKVAKEAREILIGFYSIIKGSDEYIKFSMLTGVSKFSKSSIFSGLNMIEDISLNPKYGNICGITQPQLEESFKHYLVGQDLEKIKEWYNGYNFLKDGVYNPFDLLRFFANNYRFSNYWFQSGTPSFLIKLLEKEKYFLPNISNLEIGEELLSSFDIENIKLEVLLFQTGYLTIKEQFINEEEDIIYKLKLPNKEVKTSLNKIIINYFTDEINLSGRSSINKGLKTGNIELFVSELKKLFSSLPYNNYTRNLIENYEGYYANVIFAYLQSLGYEIIGEDVTNKGRIDLTIKVEDFIYIIEFKMKSNPGLKALEQIEQRKYYEKYLRENKKIFLVGIEFDEQERNICDYEFRVV